METFKQKLDRLQPGPPDRSVDATCGGLSYHGFWKPCVLGHSHSDVPVVIPPPSPPVPGHTPRKTDR